MTGSLHYDHWTAKDGSKRSQAVIKGDRLELLGSKSDERPSADDDDDGF